MNRRALLQKVSALAAALSATLKVEEASPKPDAEFWSWWKATIAGQDKVTVTIVGAPQTGKTTLGISLFNDAARCKLGDDADFQPFSNGVLAFGEDCMMAEDGLSVADRVKRMRVRRGTCINLHRLKAYPEGSGDTYSNQEMYMSDIILQTHLHDGKYRVRVNKSRWSERGLHFSLS